MPNVSGPETPPSTAPTSPTSPTDTDGFIDCEKGSVVEEIDEEWDEKNSQDGPPNIPSKHRKDGLPKLVQRSEDLNHKQFEQLLNSS